MPPSLPSGNASAAPAPGEFNTIAEALDYAARQETGISFHSSRGELEYALGYSELRDRAIAAGIALRSAGLNRGDRVAIISETGPDFLFLFYGCQYVGLIPCPLPYTAYIGGRDAYVARISALLSSAGASMICAPPAIAEIASAAARDSGALVMTFAELARAPAGGAIDPLGAEETAYIQFSSGSTAGPKGIPVSQKALSSNVQGILNQGMRLAPDDRAFSWLPLYHDMGLVGFSIAPLYGQVAVAYLSPSAFARRPNLWLELMSRNGSTITYSPTFGYRLAAERFSAGIDPLDLSRLRVAGVGGDMIRADVLRDFAAITAASGFDPDSFMPSYGMAESTLAVSFARGVKTDRVERDAVVAEKFARPAAENMSKPERVREFVVCGCPLAGHDLVVADESGNPLADRHIGHILVRGPSLMSGYFNAPEMTAAVMRPGGFMDTGDMGYLLDGEIVVTGRSKDLILHKGRNIWPEDIEWAAERLPALSPGDVAAFSIDHGSGDEEVVVLVQCRLSAEPERQALRRDVAALVSETAGAACKVVLVAPKSLPFTTSGKLSRKGACSLYLEGTIRPLDEP